MTRIATLSMGFLAVMLCAGCLVIENRFEGLPPGVWRAELKLDPVLITPNPRGEPLPEKVNLTFEEVTEGVLPFNFEVVYDDAETFHIEIINGEERQRVDDIQFGLDRQTAKDTVIINFPVYDSYIKAIFEEKVMEGEWVVNYRENYSIPFVAYHGKDYRFTTLRKEPVMDISGRWEVQFEVETEKPFPAIGEFRQDGNHLTGTFLTETGDYRYLEGSVQENKVYLSTFDGSHAYLFEAKINPDSTMIGSFRSGKHYQTLWEARPAPNATLSDPDGMTRLLPGIEKLNIAFPNASGDTLSLDDPRYAGKVKLVQVMGTWCPNCRDETNFLLDYLARNPQQKNDLSVVALAFERYTDTDKALSALRNYKEKLDIPWEVLYAGYYDKAAAGKVLPMLDTIYSYPTLLFVDRQNRVRKIHTGFSGPATSEYPAFRESFAESVQQLLDE